MSAQRQRPIDFATEGLLLAHRVGRNCGIRVQLNEAEAAFRIQKSQLCIRPIWHHKQQRIKVDILICFLAYALWKTSFRAGRFAAHHAAVIVLPFADASTRELRIRCVVRPEHEQALLPANRRCGTSEAGISFGLIASPRNPHPMKGILTELSRIHCPKAEHLPRLSGHSVDIAHRDRCRVSFGTYDPCPLVAARPLPN
jgi:hypothetical protein